MKEIKYRAWDNVENKMYYTGEESDIHFYFDSSGIVADRYFDSMVYTPEGDSYPTGDYERLDHLAYMLGVGVKDVNGDEIYEGDILKLSKPYIGMGEVPQIVIFEDGMFKLQSTFYFGHKQYIKEFCLDRMSIIGNIYKNPEMLENN